MIRSNELCHSHLSALLPPSASAAPSQHQQSAWPQPTPSMVLKSLFTRHYLTQPPSNRLAVILGHCKLGLLGKRISRWQYSNSPMASLSRYSRLVHEKTFCNFVQHQQPHHVLDMEVEQGGGAGGGGGGAGGGDGEQEQETGWSAILSTNPELRAVVSACEKWVFLHFLVYLLSPGTFHSYW